MTRGYLRLRELAAANVPIAEYPSRRSAVAAARAHVATRAVIDLAAGPHDAVRSCAMAHLRAAYHDIRTSRDASDSDERGRPRRNPVEWFAQMAAALRNPLLARPEGQTARAASSCSWTTTRVRAETFLTENPQAVWVQTVAECLVQLVENWDEVHLDHDLGGKTFVDINEIDCGMEVIRWLCKEPRRPLERRLVLRPHP